MAVNPGDLPLSIIRGTEFSSLVLQCRDDSLLVTGTLNPDATGTYVPSGTYASFPLFILHGSPAFFCYYCPLATTYLISETLSDGVGLTDYWILPAATEPTGSYTPHGAYTGTAAATDNPVDLSTFGVEAKVRRTVNATDIYIDLNPSITDGPGGEVTIPSITSAVTDALEFTGTFKWDLIFTQGAERFGPFVKGSFIVADNITQT
jgi:hypothetical protein